MSNFATFPVRIRSAFELDQIAAAYRIAQDMAADMPPSQLQFMADVFSGVAEANDDDIARGMAQAFLDTLETIIG
jgi:hypothetical protein